MRSDMRASSDVGPSSTRDTVQPTFVDDTDAKTSGLDDTSLRQGSERPEDDLTGCTQLGGDAHLAHPNTGVVALVPDEIPGEAPLDVIRPDLLERAHEIEDAAGQDSEHENP